MCGVCSRRGLIAGAISAFVLGPTIPEAFGAGPRIACAIGSQDAQGFRKSMASKSDDPRFDAAIIAELRRVLQVMPVNPGFQYVGINDAKASDDSVITGTKGTVWIGLDLVKDLMKQKGGGASVAGVLAHECAHIFQYFTPYYDRLVVPKSALVELHADLLAGYYMGKRNDVAQDELIAFAQALIRLTGYSNLGHGSPGLRTVALEKGYMLSRDGVTFAVAASEGEKYVRKIQELL